MPSIRQFYKRINSKIDLNTLFPKISSEFNLGKYIKWELILYGYSDFNVKLQTRKGNYCVKIFSKSREKEEIVDIVNRFLTLYQNKVPVPMLYSINGKYLYTFDKGELDRFKTLIKNSLSKGCYENV